MGLMRNLSEGYAHFSRRFFRLVALRFVVVWAYEMG